MSEQDALTAWLNDIELYRIGQLNYSQLILWGHEQCGWPAVTP